MGCRLRPLVDKVDSPAPCAGLAFTRSMALYRHRYRAGGGRRPGSTAASSPGSPAPDRTAAGLPGLTRPGPEHAVLRATREPAEAAGFRACPTRCRRDSAWGRWTGNVGADLAVRAGGHRARLRGRHGIQRAGRVGRGHRQRHLHARSWPSRAGRRPWPWTAAADRAAAAGPGRHAGHAGCVRQRLQRLVVQRERRDLAALDQPRARARETSARRTGLGRLGDRHGAGAGDLAEPLVGLLCSHSTRPVAGASGRRAIRAWSRSVLTATPRMVWDRCRLAGSSSSHRPGQGHVPLGAGSAGSATSAAVGGAGGCSTPTPTWPRSALRWRRRAHRPLAARGRAPVPGALRRLRAGRCAPRRAGRPPRRARWRALAARLGVPLPAEGIPHVPSGASTDPAADAAAARPSPGPGRQAARPDRGLPARRYWPTPTWTASGSPRPASGPFARWPQRPRAAADPRSRRRPRRARDPASRTARHRAVDHRLHPDARGRRPGRLPRGRSGPAPGPGPAGRTSRARCLVASMARVRGHAAVDLARPAGRRPSSANGPAPACAYGRGAARAAAVLVPASWSG